MLNKIIEFSIKNKVLVGLFVLGLVAYGILELTKLPIDAVPDITDNQVQVITVSPALGAPDIERLITFPVEQANSNIPGLKQIRSFSRFGLSVVTIVFEDNVDVYWARQQVTERLKEAQEQIPAGLGSPTLAPVTTGLGEIYQYVVRPKPGYEGKYDPMALRTIQDWIVRRQLRDVKGVADVSSFGGYLMQYEIAVNTDKLKSYGLTINDVFNAVEKNNENTGGAYIEKEATVLFIRSEGLVGSMDDIKKIPVKSLESGIPVLLSDVADIGYGHATRYGAMTYNGEREVAGAVVMMLKGANSNDVVERVKERIARIQATLPEGVVIEPFLDRTKMVDNAISTVERNLLEGSLIVLFVLVLFLGNLRAGMLVASVIPLAMLFAVIMMNTFGVSGNLMSLGALDFGLIVDGTVIIVEAVLHQLHERNKHLYTKGEMNDLVFDTATRMSNAAVFGTIIIFIVYIPIFTLQGIEGKMFKPMAFTVSFALLGAFLLSLTYVPMMSSLALSRKVKHTSNFADRFMERIQRAYEPLLMKVTAWPRTVITASVAIVIVAAVIVSFMGGEFIPKLEEGDFAVETRVLPGSSLNTSVKAVSQGARILKAKFPEVIKVVGKTGSSEIPTDPMPLDASDMIIVLKDKKEWTSASSFDELTEKMTKELEAIPGVTFGFQYPVQMRFNELMTGARQDVVCKIFGDDMDTLAAQAKALGAVISTVKGAADLYVEAVNGMPQVLINYDRQRMAFYGLNIADVNRVVNTAFAGQAAGRVYEGERRFDMVVRLAGTQRQRVDDVRNLLIPTPRGLQIPLAEVAKIDVTESANQVQRENSRRRIVVGFNVRGRDVQSVIEELQKKVGQKIKLPTGYYVTYGGSFENLQAAKQRLAIAVPVSLALIFLLLYLAFGSLRQGLLIYSAIPLAAVGGVGALALRGMPFSISAGVGFIALFGVAVLNGIVLMTEFNRLKKSGIADIKQVAFEGARSRLRPVLMTAAVASLGFLPMALSHGAGAEVQRPLATVVIGGLITATFLTLFVLPVLYIRFQKPARVSIPNVTVLLLAVLTVGYTNARGQQVIGLQAAIDSAVHNNMGMANERVKAEYRKALTGTAWNIQSTAVVGEYGHINSSYTDNKIGISQGFSFPAVYVRQRSVLNAEWQAARLNEGLKEWQLKKEVSSAYFEAVWLMQKLRLLNEADTMYGAFLQKAVLRYQKGESNILEKATAENQKGQLEQQRTLLTQDLAQVMLRFRYLLNTEADIVPDTTVQVAELLHSAEINENPYLQYLSQKEDVAKKEVRLERSRLWPELNIGYYNQSIAGWQRIGNSEQYFGTGHRFAYLQGGLGIPLLGGAQRARLTAARINSKIAENERSIAAIELHNRREALMGQYRARLAALAFYRQTGLANAELILNAADKQFINGDVNYLQYVTLINQAIATRSAYYDAVIDLNKVIIELNNLTIN
jgi:cobalt-zinc-cadmium resistance protein CzcA